MKMYCEKCRAHREAIVGQKGQLWCPQCEGTTLCRHPVRGYKREPLREPMPKPKAKNFRNPREAEEIACHWLRYFGFDDVQLTPEGNDGGVDIEGKQVVAQVKAEMKPVGRPYLQALYGIASLDSKQAIFFALSGFTPHAIEWAEKAAIALFCFNHSGEPEPANDAASKIYSG